MVSSDTAPLDPPPSRMLLERAVGVGLTALIPIPIVDDIACNAMRRRLVRAVLVSEGAPMQEGTIEALANEPGRGCLLGSLGVLVYPLKKLFRKFFFFLEIKRCIDLVSTTWHFGWLLQGLARDGQPMPGDPIAAAALRHAIMSTLDEVGVRPVERAFRSVLGGSSGVLRAVADRLSRIVRRTDRTPQHVEAAVAAVASEEQAIIARLVDQLARAIDALPREHFDELRAALRRRVVTASAPPGGPCEEVLPPRREDR